MSVDLEALEATLGHPFKNREMLVRALTHSSRVHEQNVENPDSAVGPEADLAVGRDAQDAGRFVLID